jgi:hypothetical protein
MIEVKAQSGPEIKIAIKTPGLIGPPVMIETLATIEVATHLAEIRTSEDRRGGRCVARAWDLFPGHETLRNGTCCGVGLVRAAASTA